jgi:endo-1,4-beta-xylanase
MCDRSRSGRLNISHGELLRVGVDESMAVDPARVRFLFQGASDAEYRGHGYGGIPWRLGMLEMKP